MTPDPELNLKIDHRLPYPQAKALLEAWRAHTQTELTNEETHDAGLHRMIRQIDGALDLLAARYATHAPEAPGDDGPSRR